MATVTAAKTEREISKKKAPVGRVLLLLVPAFLLLLFYLLRGTPGVMAFVAEHIAGPVRKALGLLTSLPPLGRVSVYELLIAAGAVWLVFYIVRTVILALRGGERLRTLLRRVSGLTAVILCILCAYNWLWGSAYYVPSFAEQSGLSVPGITTEALVSAAEHFAEGANALSGTVARDDAGRITAERDEILRSAETLYDNIEKEYPSLSGRALIPKPMLSSRVMSHLGFTGVYFALTGEANVNMEFPVAFLPSTVAHELAHARGVAREDEANFVGILACITSDLPAYRYSGYLDGLNHLLGALYTADENAWLTVYRGLNDTVYGDLLENRAYWADIPESAVSAAVTAAYDGYLRAYGQTSGLQSYGECVDLLATYVQRAGV